MSEKEIPKEAARIIKEQGDDVEELIKAKKAHKKRMKKLDRQLSASMAERTIEVE